MKQWIIFYGCQSVELTGIVEGLDPIQVFIHFVLDPFQFGPCHASIYQGLGCLLYKQ